MAKEKKIKAGAITVELEYLLFPVDMHDNPRKTNKEYSKVVTGYFEKFDEQGNSTIEEMDLNYCSDIYTLIKNVDIFPNVEQVLIDNGIEFEVSYSHINHVRFYADYTITDNRYAYYMQGTNDKIMPMIRVQHSYNGLTKYRIIFGYYRLVCTNGMTISVAEMNEFNLQILGKHTENIVHSFSRLNEMLVNFSLNAKEITQRITAKYELLASNWIDNVATRIEEILEANGINAVDNSKFNTIDNIMFRIMQEANMPNLGYNGKVNDWLIYNGINQYLNDDNINIATPEKRQENDAKIFEYMLANN